MGDNGAPLTDYAPLIDAVGSLRDNNEESTAAIYSPRTGRALAKLTDDALQPLTVPPYLAGLPRYETTIIPNDLHVGSSIDCSDLFVGDFGQLYVGITTNLQVSVLTERYADTGQIGIVAWTRADIAVARPKAFASSRACGDRADAPAGPPYCAHRRIAANCCDCAMAVARAAGQIYPQRPLLVPTWEEEWWYGWPGR